MNTNLKSKTGIIISLLNMFFIFGNSYGQEFFKIEGRITNSQNQPIQFANISINKTSIGTISNENGDFVFSIPKENIDDTIIVSHIGYLTLYLKADRNNLNNQKIEMPETSYLLDEIEIYPIDPFSIILKSIGQITQNYCNMEFESEGFYREVITENDKYVEYAEGLLTTLQKPYNPRQKKQEEDLIKLIESRRKKNELEEYELSKKTKNPIGGPVSCIKYNSIKYHPSFLKANASECYNYKLTGILDYSGRDVYVIEFDQKDKVKKSLYKGEIFIDKETLAFVQLNYRKSPKGIKYSLPGAVIRGILKLFSISMEGFDKNVIVCYKMYNDEWYLSSINYTELASFIRKGKPYDIISTKNFLITFINDEISNSYLKDEVLKSGEFKDQIGEYDESFWGNYNIIPINQKLNKQLKN